MRTTINRRLKELTVTVEQHVVARKGFLESRAHERITRTGLAEDSEMDVEERQVDHEWHQN